MRKKARQHLTAIIYDKRGNVLSIGNNSYVKSHPLQAKHAFKMGEPHKINLHAEIHAITRLKNTKGAYKIIVFRYGRNGDPILAKPCNICMSAIRATNIKIIEHT